MALSYKNSTLAQSIDTTLEELAPYLGRMAQDYSNCPSTQDDLVQQAMMAIWTQIEKRTTHFEDQGHHIAWCKRMARLAMLNWIRGIRRRDNHLTGIDPSEIGSLPLLGVEHDDCNALMEQAIVNLDRRSREYIRLSFFGGLSDADIARKGNVSRAYVCKLRKRSLNEARRYYSAAA